MILKFRKEVLFENLYLEAISTDLIHKWDFPGNGLGREGYGESESSDTLDGWGQTIPLKRSWGTGQKVV